MRYLFQRKADFCWVGRAKDVALMAENVLLSPGRFEFLGTQNQRGVALIVSRKEKTKLTRY